MGFRVLLTFTTHDCAPLYLCFSAAGLESNTHYTSGTFYTDIRLGQQDTGGIEFTWSLRDTVAETNQDQEHSQIDLVLKGNRTVNTVTLHTNVVAQGQQNIATVSSIP